MERSRPWAGRVGTTALKSPKPPTAQILRTPAEFSRTSTDSFHASSPPTVKAGAIHGNLSVDFLWCTTTLNDARLVASPLLSGAQGRRRVGHGVRGANQPRWLEVGAQDALLRQPRPKHHGGAQDGAGHSALRAVQHRAMERPPVHARRPPADRSESEVPSAVRL